MSEGRLSRPVLNLWAIVGIVVVAFVLGGIIMNNGGIAGVVEGLFVGRHQTASVAPQTYVPAPAPVAPAPQPAPQRAPAAPSYNRAVPHGYLGHGNRPLSVGERERFIAAGCTIVEHPTDNGGEFQQTHCPAGVDMMSLLDPDRHLH